MALVAAPLDYMPALPFPIPAGAGNFTFDASTDLLALVFQIPKTGTIDAVHYRVTGVTSPVMTHRISLQTVSATTGLPDGSGSLYGSSTAITVDASTYGANTNYEAAVNCTGATKGDVAALVFDLSAFTSGSFTQYKGPGDFLGGPRSSGNTKPVFPYEVQNTTGSPAKFGFGCTFTAYALEYSGGEFVPIGVGFSVVGTAISTTASNSGTTRAGNRYRPVAKRRACGIWCTAGIGGNVLLRLRLQSDDSILATATVDKDQVMSGAALYHDRFFDSGATVQLTPGTDYYITLEGNDATGGDLLGFGNIVSVASLRSLTADENCYGVTYAGSYTSYTTANAVRRYNIGLITDQEDDGTGGGGGLLTHPGMAGGMRG